MGTKISDFLQLCRDILKSSSNGQLFFIETLLFLFEFNTFVIKHRELLKTYVKRLLLFLALLTLVIAYRIYVLIQFGFEYTDQDQAVLWEGVRDFSSGVFHETRYYGQGYNTMLEALLATPLYLAGVPVYQALPVVTTLLALLPFIIPASLACFRKQHSTGYLILLLALAFPADYDLITTLSRGFITGIALASVSFIWMDKKTPVAYYLFALFIVLGFTVNPNSIILSGPLALYFWLKNSKQIQLYFYGSAGLLTGWLIHSLLNSFYTRYPNYELHRPSGEFAWSYFTDGIEHFDLFFDGLIPLYLHWSWLALLLPVFFAIYFFRTGKRAEGYTCIIIPFVLLLPLFNSRLHNASDTIFYSYSRMFLAFPVLLVALLYFLPFKKINPLFYLPFLGVFVFKLTVFQENLDKRLNESTYILVRPVEDVLKKCQDLKKLAEKHHAELILITDFGYILHNYACAACTDNFPNTLYPTFERRTWRLIDDKDKIYPSVLIIDSERKLEEKEGLLRLEEDPRFFLIPHNITPTYDLMIELDIYPRGF